MKWDVFTAVLFLIPFFVDAEIAGWSNIDKNRKMPVPAKLYWSEDFSGSMEDFLVEYRDGAKGEVSIVDAPDFPREKALRINKTNDRGVILVRPKKALKVPLKTQLQCAALVSCTDVSSDYTLGYLRLTGPKEDLTYYSKLDGRGGGGPKMTFLTNTAPGVRERKLCHRLADRSNDGIITPVIVISGPPSVSYWMKWTIEDFAAARKAWEKGIGSKKTPNRKNDLIDRNEFRKQLADDIDHTARVVTRDGETWFLVDEKVTAPIIYAGFSGTLKKIIYQGQVHDEAGLRIQRIAVSFGHSHRLWGVWRGKDDFAVQEAADLIEAQMRLAPHSKFILTMFISPYENFCKDFPEETWIHSSGLPVYGSHVHAVYFLKQKVPKQYWLWPSMHSEVWKKAVIKNISLLTAELQKRHLSKRIIGVHLAGFHDHQFSTRHFDYSKPALEGFKKWLWKKYKTESALREAWRMKDITFDTVTAPRFSTKFETERTNIVPEKQVLDPELDRKAADFIQFQKQQPFHMQEEIASHVRKVFGKPLVIARWCMATFAGDGGGAYDIGPFLNSKVFDILIAQPNYTRRTPGLGCGVRLPLASFRMNGKLFVNEFDLRTYAGLSHRETELRVIGLSQASDFTMWQTIHRKMAGQMIAQHMGYWYLDMASASGGWFSLPELCADLTDVRKLAEREYAKTPSKWHPDAAVVIDEEGLLLRNFLSRFYNFDGEFLIPEQLQLLAGSGVPYDILLLEDLLKHPETALRYKLIVFGGMFAIDASRQKMLDNLKEGNRTLVFLSGSGRTGGIQTTGFTIDENREKRPPLHEIAAVPGEKLNLLSAMHIKMLGRLYGGRPGNYYLPQRFEIRETPGVKVRARYTAGNKAAVAERDFGSWLSVAVADAGGLTPEYFNELAIRSGAYAACKPGVQVDMNGNFMSLHSMIAGKRSVKLPFPATVRNLKDNSIVAEKATEFELELEPGTTWFFDLTK